MSIFVSYRRDDSQHIADRMYDRLVTAFGQDGVFKDIDCIPLGVDFRRILQDAVSRCQILLAIIGNRWVTVADQAGQRRLDNPDDFVRIEIETALQRGIPVIPVRVDGASTPQVTDLPPSLQELPFRNGAVIRPDPDFHRDMDRLIKACRGHRASRNAVPLRPPVEPSRPQEVGSAGPVSPESLQYVLLDASSHAAGAHQDEVLARMKAAGELETNEEYQAGFEAGRDWAKDSAGPKELKRLSAYIANFDSRLDWWDIDYPGWNAPFGATDYFVFEVWLDRKFDRGAPDEFWEHALGDDAHRVQDADFFHGFGDGADEVWRRVKDRY